MFSPEAPPVWNSTLSEQDNDRIFKEYIFRMLQTAGAAIPNVGTVNPIGSTPVINETPAGTIDGVNAVFTLAHAPIAGTLVVRVNGIKIRIGTDLTLVGNTITYTLSQFPNNTLQPASVGFAGDWHEADYAW